jgi:predicted metal-binding membrane protein
MDKLQKILLTSLISVSVVSWIASAHYQQMFMVMNPFEPLMLSLFTVTWTVGMAAMMFPAISPMVLLYSKLIRTSDGELVRVQQEHEVKVALFVSTYLAVWALVGVALLMTWSVGMEHSGLAMEEFRVVHAILLIIAGAYQFTSLKTKCLGYCESPMSFFMRRWSTGTFGAVKMGMYHGMYCLGCCWPYFLLMVALGWMNLSWMALFASIIFAEKAWSKGIWIARAAGVGFVIYGIFSLLLG